MQQSLSLQVFEALIGYDGVVHVAGDVDTATAPLLRAQMMVAAESTDGDVVVDLADVTFIDLRGLYALVETSSSLQAGGRRLRATRPPPIVRRLSDLAGLDGFF